MLAAYVSRACGAFLWRASLIGVVLGVWASHPAQADTRLAFSQNLGIEILADSPDWCAPEARLRVTAPNAQLFASSEFAALVARFGAVVLARQCPAAQTVHFVGTAAGNPAPVWHGSASPAAQWALRTEGAAVPAVVASSPVSPLTGEWTGTVGCDANNLTAMTVSVYDVERTTARAYVELAAPRQRADAGALRYAAEGSFDAASGQFLLHPGAVVRAGGDNPQQVSGIVGHPGDVMHIQQQCYGAAPEATLAHGGATPLLADRVRADAARRGELIAARASAPKPAGRLVGTIPPGEPRQPSCDELLAWAASSPTDLRVRLTDTDNGGILRQYDDSNSSRVFGTAAYYWFSTDANGRTEQSVQPAGIVGRACATPAARQDPRLRTLQQVASDGLSFNDLAQRRHFDDLAAELPIRVATTGGTPAQMYRDLASLADAKTAPEAFQAFTRTGLQVLTETNQAEIVSGARAMRAMLAERAAREAHAALLAEPASAAGLTDSSRVVAAFTLGFPDDAAPIRDAGEARRREIARALLAAALGRIAASPKTLDGLAMASTTATEAKGQAAEILPDAASTLDAAVQSFRTDALPGVLAAETAAIEATPATPAGAKALSAQRDRIVALLPVGTAPQAEAYRRAADAKLAAIGKGAEPALQAQLDALPGAWNAVATARQLAEQAAGPFGAAPAAAELRQLGHARARAILAALSADPIARIKAAKANSILQVGDVVDLGDSEAAPFAKDPDGGPQASRITATATQTAGDLATNLLPAYRASLSKAAASRPMALRMAEAWVVLQRLLAPRIPVFQRFADATRDAALRLRDDACAQSAARLGLSGADAALPMVIGDHVATLGVFGCDLADAGLLHGQLGAATGPNADRTFKLFARAGGGNYGWDRALAGRGLESGKIDLATVFDFSQAAAEPPADTEIEDVEVLVLRDIDVGINRKALAVVQMGDQSQLKPLSIAEWQQASRGLAVSAAGDLPGLATCAQFARDPVRLLPADAARALLGCPRVP